MCVCECVCVCVPKGPGYRVCICFCVSVFCYTHLEERHRPVEEEGQVRGLAQALREELQEPVCVCRVSVYIKGQSMIGTNKKCVCVRDIRVRI